MLEIDRKLSVQRVALLEDVYAEAFERQLFVLQLMTVFGGLALVLAAVGIFAVVSESVTSRTREIGLRVALGAAPTDVVRLIAYRGVGFVLVGIAAGLTGAGLLTRTLRSLLFEVSPMDVPSFVGAGVVLIAVAVGSCWLPIRRAIRVDPAVALRIA